MCVSAAAAALRIGETASSGLSCSAFLTRPGSTGHCPEGTPENSPTLQRWVRRQPNSARPVGTVEIARSFGRPWGPIRYRGTPLANLRAVVVQAPHHNVGQRTVRIRGRLGLRNFGAPGHGNGRRRIGSSTPRRGVHALVRPREASSTTAPSPASARAEGSGIGQRTRSWVSATTGGIEPPTPGSIVGWSKATTPRGSLRSHAPASRSNLGHLCSTPPRR